MVLRTQRRWWIAASIAVTALSFAAQPLALAGDPALDKRVYDGWVRLVETLPPGDQIVECERFLLNYPENAYGTEVRARLATLRAGLPGPPTPSATAAAVTAAAAEAADALAGSGPPAGAPTVSAAAGPAPARGHLKRLRTPPETEPALTAAGAKEPARAHRGAFAFGVDLQLSVMPGAAFAVTLLAVPAIALDASVGVKYLVGRDGANTGRWRIAVDALLGVRFLFLARFPHTPYMGLHAAILVGDIDRLEAAPAINASDTQPSDKALLFVLIVGGYQYRAPSGLTIFVHVAETIAVEVEGVFGFPTLVAGVRYFP